jgi:hypothetical protein
MAEVNEYGISQAKLQELKQKFGNTLRHVEVPMDDEGSEHFACVCSVPSRQVYGQFERLIDKDPSKARQVLVANCVHTGKEKIGADDALFLNVSTAVIELLPLRRATSRPL